MANRTVSVALVANVGSYIGGMNKAAAATLRLGESSSASTKKAQGGFDLAGKSALLMGGAVVGGLATAISKSAAFEKSMSAVGAATQATGATLLGLRDAAMKAGADTAYSATEAADAITEMGKAGVSAGDIMGGGLNGALALAAAGQIDVADAAGIASTAMAQFNLTGKDLPHVADLLAAGAGKAMGSVGDLGAALNQAGLMASASGLSIEETTGTLAAFAHAGLIGSDSGTSFKTMLAALQSPSSKAAQIMSDLGINMYDAQGNMLGAADMAGQLKDHLSGLTEEQRNSALATIFGTDAVRAANVLYKEGAKGIQGWIDKTNEAGYASKQAAALQDNLAGDLEKLGGSFDTLMISMGQGSQGPLRELVQGLTTLLDAIGGDAEAFASLPAPIRLALDAFGGLADVVGALASVFGSLSGPMQIATVAAVGWAVAGDRIMGAIRPMGSALSPMRDGWHAFGEALGYARANGDGLGTVLQSVGSYAGGQTLSAVKALGRAIGPELAVAAGAFVITSLIDGFQQLAGASDEAKAAAEGLAGALTLTDEIADRHTIRQVIQDTDGLVEALERAGISGQDAINGLLGQEGAQRRVTGALQDYINLRPGGIHNQEATDALNAKNAYEELATGYGTAAGNARYFADAATDAGGASAAAADPSTGVPLLGAAMQATTTQTEEAAKAQEQWLQTVSESLQSFVNPLGAYKELLAEKKAAEQEAAQATADSTKSSKDSWKDYVKDVDVSLGELAARLEQQLEEQANWRTNIGKIAQWAGADVANYLLQMGQDGAAIVAKMADGTTADAKRMAADITKAIQGGGLDQAAAMDQAGKVLAAIGRAGGKATVAGIAAELGLGVDVIAGIVGRFGIKLANGLNPILVAVGKKKFAYTPGTAGTQGSGPMSNHWSGGYTGDGGKYEPKGVVHGGEFVFTKEQTSRAGVNQLSALAGMLSGYSGGGFVSADSVPRPYSTAPYRAPLSTAGDGVMGREYDEVTAWLKANQEPNYSGTATAGSGALVAFGHMLQRMGARVSEHPAFGGVTMGAHVRNSKHYSGRAIDVNTRPGTSALEQRELAPMAAMARKAGFQTIFMAPGHYNHLHVASYKTGTPYVPKDGYAYLHQGERVVPKEQNLRSREFSGGGSGGGVSIDYDRLAKAVGRSTTVSVIAPPDYRQLAATVVNAQRDMDFLHG